MKGRECEDQKTWWGWGAGQRKAAPGSLQSLMEVCSRCKESLHKGEANNLFQGDEPGPQVVLLGLKRPAMGQGGS